MATDYGLKEYTDLDSMLQFAELDAVLLASVTSHHAQQIITSLNGKVHVIVDRPITFSISECEQVIKRSEETGKILSVAQVLNFWPEYIKVREMINTGALGTITNVTTSRVSGLINQNWSFRLLNPIWGFGGLEALIHDIDFLNGLWGTPEVTAVQGNLTPAGGYQQVHALLKYGEKIAGIEADYGVAYNYPLTMYFRAIGTKGTLQYVFRGGLAKQNLSTRSLTFFPVGSEPEVIEVSLFEAFQAQASDFVECVKNNSIPEWGNMYQAKANLETVIKIIDLWRR